jgi:hypothetical protein
VRITGHHRDAAEARRLAQEQADRAAAARLGDRSLRWVASASLQPPAEPAPAGSTDVDAQPGESAEPGGVEQL